MNNANYDCSQTCNCRPMPSPEHGLTLAITTVPIQPWETPYDPATGLKHGTIFPGLDLPFYVLDQKGGAMHG